MTIDRALANSQLLELYERAYYKNLILSELRVYQTCSPMLQVDIHIPLLKRPSRRMMILLLPSFHVNSEQLGLLKMDFGFTYPL